MRKSEKEKKCSCCKLVGYVAGSIAVFAIAAIVVPTLLDDASGKINKKYAEIRNRQRDDEDWGPVIEKIDKEEN